MLKTGTLVGTMLGVLIALNAACATAKSEIKPSGTASTLMPGWEQKFDVKWQATAAPGGTRHIQGYLVSHHGRAAYTARVLVQTVDASGAVVDRRIAPVAGGVSGLGRSYFEVAHLSSADHYLVTVWDYTLGREP
jgi:hypothetical protein